MNVLKQEFKMFSRQALLWTISLLVMVVVFISLFDVVASRSAIFLKVMGGFPEEIRKAFGLMDLNFTSIMGFYGFAFIYLTLMGSIHAMNLSLSMLSVEIREKSVDFLLAKPIKRQSIVTQKLLAVILYLFSLNVLVLIVSKIACDIAAKEPYDFMVLLQICFSLFLTQLFFVGLGMLMSVMLRKIKNVTPLAFGTVFLFFIFNMIGQTVAKEVFQFITPFLYFPSIDIIKTGSYNFGFVLLDLSIVTLTIAASYFVYIRKDMPST